MTLNFGKFEKKNRVKFGQHSEKVLGEILGNAFEKFLENFTNVL